MTKAKATKLDKEIQEGLYDPKSKIALVKGLSYTAYLGYKRAFEKSLAIQGTKLKPSSFEKWKKIERRIHKQKQYDSKSKSYSDEMSEKIMTATPAQMREIAESIEYSVYEELTPQAKTKVTKALNLISDKIYTRGYDPKKPATIYVITDARGNRRKATYAEWLKWMKEQKKLYDLPSLLKILVAAGALLDPQKKLYDPKNTIEKAKAFFKVTKNPYEAGYILPNGSMLDLSGRHYASGYKNSKPLPGQPDYLRNQRSVDHREVAKVIGKSGTAGMLMFMKETGAIRLAVLGSDINIALFNSIKPTLQQKKTLANIINYTGGVILYDRWDEKGDTIKSGEVSSTKVFDPKTLSLPPTRWYEAMVKGIKKSSDVRNPYAIVKSIWTKLSPSKRSEIKAREKKGEQFRYDLPLPVDKPTRGTGTVRMVKPFKLAEVQVNLSVKDYLTARASGLFQKMKRQDGTTALVARCKSPEKNVNVFVDKV